MLLSKSQSKEGINQQSNSFSKDITLPADLESLSIAALLELFPAPPLKSTGSPSKILKKEESQSSGLGRMNTMRRMSGILKPKSSSTAEFPVGLLSKRKSESGASGQTFSSGITAPSTESNKPVGGSFSVLKQISDSDEKLSYSLPPGIPERDYADFLKRACKGVIAPKEQELLFKFLLALPPSEMFELQKKTQEMLIEKSPLSKGRSSMSVLAETFSGKTNVPFAVEISKYHMDFGLKGRRVKIEESVSDSFTLDPIAGKAKYTIHPPSKTPGYELIISPITGKLKAKDKPEEIQVSIKVKRPVSISDVLVVEFEGSFKHFLAIKLNSEWSHFGCTLDELEFEGVEIFPGKSRHVPKVLNQLRSLLIKANGLEMEEIFRKQVDEEKIMIAREQVDKQQHMDTLTPHVLSNLIKVWFRELPERLFEVEVDEVIKCDTKEKCLNLFETRVKGKERDIALWLFDLMAELIKNKEKNRMSAKKLAIVFAPNIFPLHSTGNTNAEYLRKQSDVFMNVLEDCLQKHGISP